MRRLIGLFILPIVVMMAVSTASAAGGGSGNPIRLITRGWNGDPANGYSEVSDISADGTKIVFGSVATNLVAETDNNGQADLFLYDTVTDTVTLISHNTTGTSTANNWTGEGWFSPDETKIVFYSEATNLTAESDTNNKPDVFLYDIANQTTTLISKNTSGNTTGNDGSGYSDLMSTDGTRIFFNSYATDLTVHTDTNDHIDVFMYHVPTDTVTLVSKNVNGTASGNGRSLDEGLSADGSQLIVISNASDLTSTPDTNNTIDIFLYDVLTDEMTLISHNANNTGAANSASGGFGDGVDISADGNRIVFSSLATNLTSDPDQNTLADIFVYDLALDTMTRITNGPTNCPNGANIQTLISNDGSTIFFTSCATELTSEDDINTTADAFIYDLTTGTTKLVSKGLTGTTGNGWLHYALNISEDGQRVLFASRSSNLTDHTWDSDPNLYLYHVETDTIKLITQDITGLATGNEYVDPLPTMSDDGRHIIFASGATDLTDDTETTGISNVFLYTQPPAPIDIDGDHDSEVAIFRSGAWHLYNYADSSLQDSIWTGTGGGVNPIPVMVDMDGDGRDELSVYDSGAWHFFNEDGSYNKGLWVAFDALPVPADYDGDGDDDLMLWDDGAWHEFDYATGAYLGGVWTGGEGVNAIPAPMDYDGDGDDDYTVVNNGAWHFFNYDGSYNKGVWVAFLNAIPVPGDYDANGTDDLVLFESGAWHWFDFATGNYVPARSVYTGTPAHKYGGVSLPAPLDYDGDGELDFTIYAGGPWHFYNDAGSLIKTIPTGGVVGDRDVSARPPLP